MDRRSFLEYGVLVGGAGLTGGFGLRPGPRADLVLRRATLFDGTGAPGIQADVGITGDRISGIGAGAGPQVGTGAEEIDLAGLALAPGFIDIHSHADLSLLVNPRAESRIRQGVTLEVVGQDGSSVGPWSEDGYRATRERYARQYGVDIDFRDIGGFLQRLGRTPAAVNLASMVGHGTVREFVVGGADRGASPEEIRRMRATIRSALQQGAVGLSSGLEYTPGSFASTGEVVELARELDGTGYPYASHVRNEDDRLLAAVEEVLHVGLMAGVPVQISHLKAQGQRNWWKAGAVLRTIEEARDSGVDVHFDRYPYVAYSTGLSSLFPPWARAGGTTALLRRLEDPETLPRIVAFTRAKVALLGSWDAVQITSTRTAGNAGARGRRLGELAKDLGEEPFELTKRLIVEESNSVGMIGFGMSEENTAAILSHPLAMICSDGGSYATYGPLSGGSPHPRAYGTFPRLLGRYVRERGDMPLEMAIHKVTGMPAAKLKLRDRGVVRVGAFADLVAFDPSAVADTATFSSPHQYPLGIPLVIVNGQITIRDGEQTGALAGRPIFGSGE
ncbi:MAG: D-aminoacylase [Gemmatimonadota bacterium]|nr:MAG: D-aminoacylase [Gemmatimonadota bacterium]